MRLFLTVMYLSKIHTLAPTFFATKIASIIEKVKNISTESIAEILIILHNVRAYLMFDAAVICRRLTSGKYG
jgi:hypothetical protein